MLTWVNDGAMCLIISVERTSVLTELLTRNAMDAVSLMADPWEWFPPPKLKVGDGLWSRNYRLFKGRLHWLLLWNGKVHIADSFVLFNRQIEQWLLRAHEAKSTRFALERLFGEKVIQVPMRAGHPGTEFRTLTSVDEEHVRGNPKYRWYVDGPPSKRYISLLDKYLGLPDPKYSASYHGPSFPNKMRECFVAAVNRTSGLETLYEEFRTLRETLPGEAIRTTLDLAPDQWRRSHLYTLLGYGVDARGRFVSRGAYVTLRAQWRELGVLVADMMARPVGIRAVRGARQK